MKRIVFLLATALCVTLVGTTWALTRVAAWIVFHDTVGGKMVNESANVENAIAECFLIARDFQVPALEAVLGVIFLGLLWRTLFAKPPVTSNA